MPRQRIDGLEPRRKRYICKFCKVEVIGKFNFKPLYGLSHSQNCPRQYT